MTAPIPLPTTTERRAVRIAMTVKKGELAELEHEIAVAIGAVWGEESDRCNRERAEMREQIEQLTERIRDLGDEAGRMAS